MRGLGCALALALMSSPATALDINCNSKYSSTDMARLAEVAPGGAMPTPAVSCKSVFMKGQIEVGDADKFARILRDYHPFLVTVFLQSPGGSVEEALKIGRLIRSHLIATDQSVVPWCAYGSSSPDCEQQHCSSACFFIWSAGIFRRGTKIGLHRPTSTGLVGMTPEGASAWYRQILKEIDAYLREMEVPPRFFQIMTSTTSAGVRLLSSSEIESLWEVPSIDEWLTAECGKEGYQCRSSKLWRARVAGGRETP